MAPPSRPPPTLLTLPPELLLQISHFLHYPDLLALKHTHPTLYTLIHTTVYNRVDWLLERPTQGLPLPQTKCIMKTDQQFCNHVEIREFMRRRRRHLDCKGGCFVGGKWGCDSSEQSRHGGRRGGGGTEKGRYSVAGLGIACAVLVLALLVRWVLRNLI